MLTLVWFVLYTSRKTRIHKSLKKYKDVFTWSYDDMKPQDIMIIHLVIPINKDVNPFQKNLRNTHSSLEPLLWRELEILDVKIIFLVFDNDSFFSLKLTKFSLEKIIIYATHLTITQKGMECLNPSIKTLFES